MCGSYLHVRSLLFPDAPERDALGDIVSGMSELTDRLSSLAARAGRGDADGGQATAAYTTIRRSLK